MNLEDTLLTLFERTLDSTKDDHLQIILASQAKIIQQRKENVGPVSAIQKKLEAIEKNFIYQDPCKKRRRSKYDQRSNAGSFYDKQVTQPDEEETQDYNEVQLIRRENGKLQEKITQLEYQQREEYLKNCNEVEHLRKEKLELVETKKKNDDKQRVLNQRASAMLTKEKHLEKLASENIAHQQQIQQCLVEQQRDDLQLNQRREAMEQLQIQLNTSVSQLLGFQRSKLKVQSQLNVQIDAIEFLVQSTLKERSVLAVEQQYLRQFKERVLDEKKQIMKLKEQMK